jgi:S1-C subfamily serine protease
MKQKLILFFLYFFATNAFAANNWIGFKNTANATVPKIIQDSSKSVFRIFYPTAPFEIIDLSDVSKLESIIKQYSDKNWETIQLAYCRVQEILKCPVSSKDSMGAGSAFVIHDSKTLATNLHNLHPWLSSVIENNNWTSNKIKENLRKLVVPIILLDQNQNVVFSPITALSSGAYHINLINDNPKLFVVGINPRQLLFALSDYVELQFVNDLKSPPLALSESSVAESYFVVGYPGPTDLFAKLGGEDGDGLSQRVSMGTSTDQELSSSPGTAAAQEKYFARITAPSYVGNSGGPVFNDNGQVTGILLAGDLYRKVDGKPAFYSEFIKLQKLDDLKLTWQSEQP